MTRTGKDYKGRGTAMAGRSTTGDVLMILRERSNALTLSVRSSMALKAP